jgi:hypothetical protein
VSIGNYYIDPVALRELEGIMVDARQQGQTLVIFYPPIPQPVLAVRSIEFAHYRATINALLSADDIVLDFNSARYESLRTDPHNFVDAVHLSKTGANFVVSELSKLLEQTDVERNTALH